jgi:E3 ubiquitin-protein ligase HERC2
VNIDILMEMTNYEGIDSTANHVKWFWEVLREVTPKDRQLFLRFVWGRSRLPQGKNFKRFKLTALNKGGNEDGYLPVSHTCFFQLDLPTYSSKDVVREKLLYAITHCQAIDLDRVAEGAFDDAE